MTMYNVTQVDFYNPDREHVYKGLLNDETEFDTHNEEELAKLFWEFCKENGLIEVYKTRKRCEYPSPIGQGDGCSGGEARCARTASPIPASLWAGSEKPFTCAAGFAGWTIQRRRFE